MPVAEWLLTLKHTLETVQSATTLSIIVVLVIVAILVIHAVIKTANAVTNGTRLRLGNGSDLATYADEYYDDVARCIGDVVAGASGISDDTLRSITGVDPAVQTATVAAYTALRLEATRFHAKIVEWYKQRPLLGSKSPTEVFASWANDLKARAQIQAGDMRVVKTAAVVMLVHFALREERRWSKSPDVSDEDILKNIGKIAHVCLHVESDLFLIAKGKKDLSYLSRLAGNKTDAVLFAINYSRVFYVTGNLPRVQTVRVPGFADEAAFKPTQSDFDAFEKYLVLNDRVDIFDSIGMIRDIPDNVTGANTFQSRFMDLNTYAREAGKTSDPSAIIAMKRIAVSGYNHVLHQPFIKYALPSKYAGVDKTHARGPNIRALVAAVNAFCAALPSDGPVDVLRLLPAKLLTESSEAAKMPLHLVVLERSTGPEKYKTEVMDAYEALASASHTDVVLSRLARMVKQGKVADYWKDGVEPMTIAARYATLAQTEEDNGVVALAVVRDRAVVQNFTRTKAALSICTKGTLHGKQCELETYASTRIAAAYIKIIFTNYVPPESLRMYNPGGFWRTTRSNFDAMWKDGYAREVRAYTSAYGSIMRNMLKAAAKMSKQMFKYFYDYKNYIPKAIGGNGLFQKKIFADGFVDGEDPDAKSDAEDVKEPFMQILAVIPVILAAAVMMIRTMISIIKNIKKLKAIDIALAIMGTILFVIIATLVTIVFPFLSALCFVAIMVKPTAIYVLTIIAMLKLYLIATIALILFILVDALVYWTTSGSTTASYQIRRMTQCASIPTEWYQTRFAHDGNTVSNVNVGFVPCGCIQPCGKGYRPRASAGVVRCVKQHADENAWSPEAAVMRRFKGLDVDYGGAAATYSPSSAGNFNSTYAQLVDGICSYMDAVNADTAEAIRIPSMQHRCMSSVSPNTCRCIKYGHDMSVGVKTRAARLFDAQTHMTRTVLKYFAGCSVLALTTFLICYIVITIDVAGVAPHSTHAVAGILRMRAFLHGIRRTA